MAVVGAKEDNQLLKLRGHRFHMGPYRFTFSPLLMKSFGFSIYQLYICEKFQSDDLKNLFVQEAGKKNVCQVTNKNSQHCIHC